MLSCNMGHQLPFPRALFHSDCALRQEGQLEDQTPLYVPGSPPSLYGTYSTDVHLFLPTLQEAEFKVSLLCCRLVPALCTQPILKKGSVVCCWEMVDRYGKPQRRDAPTQELLKIILERLETWSMSSGNFLCFTELSVSWGLRESHQGHVCKCTPLI